MDKDNPCTPDCPERNDICHATCPRYAKYARKCEERRAARLRERAGRYESAGAVRNERQRIKDAKRGR